VAPHEILPMLQASRQSDEEKFSSGVSQSQRGDDMIEIVQYSSYIYWHISKPSPSTCNLRLQLQVLNFKFMLMILVEVEAENASCMF
jgi:hypothetical protein